MNPDNTSPKEGAKDKNNYPDEKINDHHDPKPQAGPDRSRLRKVLDNLTQVETSLQSVLETHRHGEYGFLTREWGFTAPGGLGGELKGKYYPWELKLKRCKTFFWPIECYEAMEVGPDFGRPDPEMVKDLPPEAEQLYGNARLHMYLKKAPRPDVELVEEDYRDYRDAARIFILLGTLSHLYGSSAPDGPKTAELPNWIEYPLIEVARRLQIEPSLSAHFLQQENWIWKSDAEDAAPIDGLGLTSVEFRTRSSMDPYKRRSTRISSKRMEHLIVATLLRECECKDRIHRITSYPECFLGSQCVDVVIENCFTNNREDAVRLLRRINRSYNLFSHVSNDNYELMDHDCFYKFQDEWQTRRFMAVSGQLEDSNIDGEGLEYVHDGDDGNGNGNGNGNKPTPSVNKDNRNEKHRKSVGLTRNEYWKNAMNSNTISTRSVARLSGTYTNARIVPRKHASMNETISIIHMMAKVKVKDRRHRLRMYKQCFVGKQLIDVLMEHEAADTRKDCLDIALAINQRMKLFEHVKHHHLLKDRHLFYRFTDTFRTLIEEQAHASTMVDAGGIGTIDFSGRRVSISEKTRVSYIDSSAFDSAAEFVDENLQQSLSDFGDSYNDVLGVEEEMEFALDNITMLYPAFGNNHERINQLVPACMGFALSSLPFDVLDILSVMRNILEAKLSSAYDGDDYEMNRLYDLIYKVAFSVSKCKEEFQQMSTDPKKRTCNSKYVSIKQSQPLSNGVLVRSTKDGKPEPRKGTTGTQFPYFHLLDWLLGRHQYKKDSQGTDVGLVAAVGSIDDTFPRPQREYIRCLTKLDEFSSIRGFLEVITPSTELLTAYNHLIECYAGEGGLLQAHCRKLYSYIHNNVQSSTSGTNHLASSEEQYPDSSESTENSNSGCPMSMGQPKSPKRSSSGCPMSMDHTESGKIKTSGCPMSMSSEKQSRESAHSRKLKLSSNDSSNAIDNHNFALTMFKHMQMAAQDRWKLRLPPLMNEVKKIIYSTSESGGFTTVALDLSGTGLLYEYGDVVKVILPNDDRQTRSWLYSLKSMNQEYFKLKDMINLQKNTGNGWGWEGLWEALGWNRFEQNGGNGVPIEMIVRYIEQASIRDELSNKLHWVHSPLHLSVKGASQMFALPPAIPTERIRSLEPVSPRIYSVSGVEVDRVFLLVSKPDDHARHHGYSSMSDPNITTVHCSFSPATFFLLPPKGVNLVCVASGTGISPFVGLVDAIRSRAGSYTIVHQCKSSDMFMCNCQTWLDFTAMNPGAIVMGYISGDRSRRNCPMRYVIRNGSFEETTVLRRHRISAYYFECESFQSRLVETYKSDGLNLAYCCGGVKSAIMPLRTFTESRQMKFEFTNESYGIPPTLTKESNLLSQIGGTIIDLNHIAPIHTGGDQILHQATDITKTLARAEKKDFSAPDLSVAFYELHPHAYNLLRCLRTPVDADAKAFAKFLQRQAISNSVLGNMATKYAQAALSAPESSRIMKIATELQSSAISAQLNSGDTEGAERTASYLKQLLDHVPEDENDTERWGESLSLLPPSRRKSSVVFR